MEAVIPAAAARLRNLAKPLLKAMALKAEDLTTR